MRRLFPLFLFALSSCIDAAPFGGHVNGNSTLSVTGTNSTSVAQDVTNVRLGVYSEGIRAQQAQQNTSSKVQAILESLSAYNLTNLQTDSISLTPLYNYTDTPARIVGFSSSTFISYGVSPELAGQILDNAVRAGANEIDAVDNTVTDSIRKSVYNQTLANAAIDAEEKARQIARTLGLCLRMPLSVEIESDESMYNAPTPTFFDAAAMSMSSETAAPTVVAGKSTVSATVKIVYAQGTC